MKINMILYHMKLSIILYYEIHDSYNLWVVLMSHRLWLTIHDKYEVLVTLKLKMWTKNDLNCARNKSIFNERSFISDHEYSFLFEPRNFEFHSIKHKNDFLYFVNFKFMRVFIWVCCDLIYALVRVQFNAQGFRFNEILDYVCK